MNRKLNFNSNGHLCFGGDGGLEAFGSTSSRRKGFNKGCSVGEGI